MISDMTLPTTFLSRFSFNTMFRKMSGICSAKKCDAVDLPLHGD